MKQLSPYRSMILMLSCAAAAACGSTSGGNSGTGAANPPGSLCILDSDCASFNCEASGRCSALSKGTSGVPGQTPSGGTGASSSGGAGPTGFVGAPGTTGFRPLTPGCGPQTSGQCTNTCEQTGGVASTVLRPPALLCFSGALDPTPNDPIAIIEQVIEEVQGKRMVHLRVTFDPAFVDNTYGTEAIGWDKGGTGGGGAPGMPGKMPTMKAGKSGHTFKDLVGSDHVELLLTNGDGATTMQIDVDYISQSAASTCGYDNLGVTGGEGKVSLGNASAVLAASSSLDRNLSGCGYCYTEDSPSTDAKYTPNAATPNWDYRVVYEVWIDLGAFGNSGFGQAYINSVHASPSKLETNTVEVEPTPCPPTWDTPYCPPGVQTGANCVPTGGCPPNWELYVATEGQSFCTPIPFSNYPGMSPCPQGYLLDPATEGRYCVPVK